MCRYENRPWIIVFVSEYIIHLPLSQLQTAAPKKWQGHDGKLTYMDTPYTIRAKELRDIYNSINMKYLTQDERLDVLLTLKHTVKVCVCVCVDFVTNSGSLLLSQAPYLRSSTKLSCIIGAQRVLVMTLVVVVKIVQTTSVKNFQENVKW